MKLYDISEAFENLKDLEVGSEEEKQAIADAIVGLGEELDKKIDGISAYVQHLNSDIEAIDAEIKRLSERKASLNKKVDSIKGYVLYWMKTTGLQKHATSLHTIALQKNPTSVVIYREDQLPKECYTEKVQVTLSKTLVKEMIEKGEICVDVAELHQTERLVIK